MGNGWVYAATDGGVLAYQPASTKLTTIGLNEGLESVNISAIHYIDGKLILGGGDGNGRLQIHDLNTGLTTVIDLEFDRIHHIAAFGDKVLAVFSDGQDWGIIELRSTAGRFVYADIYRNFPISVSTIYDIDMTADSIFVASDGGLLASNYRTDNLKDPNVWQLTIPSADPTVLSYHIDDTGHYLLQRGAIYERGLSTWDEYISLPNLTPYGMTRLADGHFVVAWYSSLHIVRKDGNSSGTQGVPHNRRIVDITTLAGEVYVAQKAHGMARFYMRWKGWVSLMPNMPASQSYTAIQKMSNGDIVAAGPGGLARLRDGSWYNILPGFTIDQNWSVDSIDDDVTSLSKDIFLADTISFRGGPTWNILQRSNGNLVVGLRGSRPGQGGILEIDMEHPDQYQLYDTTDGIIDGLIQDGFMTVRGMTIDSGGNLWVAVAAAENRGESIAILTTDGEWVHYSVSEVPDYLNLMPNEIVFDRLGRAWIASEENSYWNSNGGLVVLDPGASISNKDDDTWTRANISVEISNTIWSLAFDSKGLLWTLSAEGVMAYTVDPDLTLRPFTTFGHLLADIPFVEGSRLKIDAGNNVWVSSPQDGMWVILENTTFWPDINGFNVDNSGLPSNEVLDIYLDNENGLVYVSTTAGISILRMPFKTNVEGDRNLVVFPAPFRIPSDRPMIIDGLAQGAMVKIYTITGHLIRELVAETGGVASYQAQWDGKDERGRLVGSGVYYVSGFESTGKTGIAKIAVIRK